jgi:hypothetical protein
VRNGACSYLIDAKVGPPLAASGRQLSRTPDGRDKIDAIASVERDARSFREALPDAGAITLAALLEVAFLAAPAPDAALREGLKQQQARRQVSPPALWAFSHAISLVES